MARDDEDMANEPIHVNGVESSSLECDGDPAENQPRRSHEPIAIVGMACRLPGDASSPSKLWDLLIEGRSGHCDIPASRFNASGFYHPDTHRPGSINATGGYFINEDIRMFENSFFGINNLEAQSMDPQQRKLLEVVYECFESAGATLHELSGANVGCYVGNFTTDYQIMQFKDPEYLSRYSATGQGPTILANRINHVFDLKGPSLVLDTACSSSLYCLHTACAALDANECDAAIVASANLIQSPEIHLGAGKAGILSGTSTCHTFDASADGYGRAEGVGVLYVKRLSDAIRDNDPIRSIIRGTAVNSNGHTNGITHPSAAGQEAVMRKAYSKAGLALDETDYVEAHGTGTPVGDPIEVEAISRVFRHKSGQPTMIGSVKTNLGHGEGVSGITSIIKVTLALENGLIPPTIGVASVNPDLKLHERNVAIVTELTPWPKGKAPRASINSFGYGGANAHAILESAVTHAPDRFPNKALNCLSNKSTLLLPFSANSEVSLKLQVADLADLDVDLQNLAYTLVTRRSSLAIRGFLLARQMTIKRDLALSNLRTLGPGKTSLQLPISFIFTGQGSQWPEMGRELMEECPIFRKSIQDMDACLAALPEPPTWSLQGTFLEPAATSSVYLASHSQPLCTAIQVALVELLKAWNIVPQAVLGHSSGEIAAAFAAGHLTVSEAITIAYYRGYVVSNSCLKGAMMAVGLDSDAVSAEITKLNLGDSIRMACINSPESVTISGDPDAIDTMNNDFQARGVFARKLKTDGKAYHSHHMGLLGESYEELLLQSHIKKKSPESTALTAQMFSSVLNRVIEAEETSSAAYWRRNLESPVLFSPALESMLAGGEYHFIELGPHSALELPIKQICKKLQMQESQVSYCSALQRGKNSVNTLLQMIGNLYVNGHDISFEKVNSMYYFAPKLSSSLASSSGGAVIPDLPKYNWDYGSLLWNESRISSEFRDRKHPRHDLLGSQVPGGSGHVASWRNVLRIEDVPWLEDHKLGRTVVFPGAGYLAMAIEALCQLQDIHISDTPKLILRQVHLVKVLILSHGTTGVEIFTQLRQAPVSNATSSKKWWQFEISSFVDGVSAVHASGSIAVETASHPMDRGLESPEDLMESQATRIWYDKLAREGLNFGPYFQSLTEVKNDRARKVCRTISRTHLFHAHEDVEERQSRYLVHPITMDALLQTAIIASTAGTIENLHGKVPVSIGGAQIVALESLNPAETCTIHAVSEPVGFGVTIISAELLNQDDQVLVQFDNVRLASSQMTNIPDETIKDRHPMLRVLWKPDVSSMWDRPGNTLTKYAEAFSRTDSEKFIYGEIRQLAGALDLLAHRNPNIRVLELGNENDRITTSLLDLLSVQQPLKRFQTYVRGSISESGSFTSHVVDHGPNPSHEADRARKPIGNATFDVILILSSMATDKYLNRHSEQLLKHVAPDASLIFVLESSKPIPLNIQHFSTVSSEPIDMRSMVVMAQNSHRPRPSKSPITKKIVLVEGNSDHPMNANLQSGLSTSFGQDIARITLQQVSPLTVPPGCIVVSTIELETPLLDRVTDTELSLLKTITDNVSLILWITGGGLLNAQRPEFALVLGLSRALMLEQPSLKFLVLDIEPTESDHESTLENVLHLLNRATVDPKVEYELLQHNGVLYSSRFVPEQTMNKRFCERRNADAVKLSLGEASYCQLSIKTPGEFDTLHFIQQTFDSNTVMPDYVEVTVKCVGLNAKDLHVLNAKVDTKHSTCGLEFSGIVTRIGMAVSSLVIGDRVLVMAPHHFGTYEYVPEWACCKMQVDEDFETLASFPLVFSTALYALRDRANLASGETVLIHSAAGGVGIAAVQIAQREGAEIYATVGTESKKQFLIDNFNFEPDHIFSSRDSSFLDGILKATHGRGVDVVLNCLTGDLLHDGWRACAEFGRFVEIGKRDMLDGGKLEMEIFQRSATFTAFDLTSLYHSGNKSHRDTWSRLLRESLQLLRDGMIRPISPLKVFDISEITQAFRHFSLANRMGKVAVSLQNTASMIDVVCNKHNAVFDPEKAYLLVGCLGGLGRSLARWMLKRGARKFVFFGRSGTEKQPARELVDYLKGALAHVDVIRGDVSATADVEKLFSEIISPIGGVIHAAMGLDEALFTSMTSKNWHTSIGPKVKGTWNLHNALRGRDSQLDFFLITSSISGSVGTATESNYCAANTFLDSFARYRRSLNLPATSLGLGMISEVGYLHEHPEIEALLARKGIHAINEEEMLQIVDIALTHNVCSNMTDSGHFAEAHILTGLEVIGLQKIRDKGFEGGSHVLDDPRASLIARALNSSDSSGATATEGSQSSHLPPEIVDALAKRGEDGEGDHALLDAAEAVLARKICNLLLLSEEQLSPQTQLADFGMDSMLAAEFRTFVFNTFAIDVPFLTLLDKTTSVESLAKLVMDGILASEANGASD